MPTKEETVYSAKYIEKMEKLMEDIQRAQLIITKTEGILALLQDEFNTIMSRTDLSNNKII
jgi:hypothetical protein